MLQPLRVPPLLNTPLLTIRTPPLRILLPLIPTPHNKNPAPWGSPSLNTRLFVIRNQFLRVALPLIPHSSQ